VRLLRHDESKPHLLCLAKKAVAIFRMSLFLKNPILFAELRQLLALGCGQTRASLAAIGLRVLDPLGECGGDEVQLPRPAPTLLPS
jgi:hypothetical protein